MAFYEVEGDAFLPTALTRGPWDPKSQHAGPPAALLGRAIERVDDRADLQVARCTVELLRPVPLSPLEVSARITRPGRSVQLVEGTLAADGDVVAQARAWRVRTADLGTEVAEASPAPPGPEAGRQRPFFPTGADAGYHTAMEIRFTDGTFTEPGPATAWMRMRVPLITGEEPSPLERVLVAADSGNGVSSVLDYRGYVFVNTDLTVHLHRLPAGEWVCLDARTVIQRHGIGLTTSALYDRDGPLGMALQTLFVAGR